jgi:hypothetical protein
VLKLKEDQPAVRVEIPALQAFNSYVDITTTITFPKKDLDGPKLEYLGAISAVLASGYARGSLYKFIERFAYHLTFEQTQWMLQESQLFPTTKKLFENLTVPFLAPVDSKWDKNLKDLLTVFFQEKLKIAKTKARKLSGGTCKLFGNTEQYDLSISDGNGLQVIAMEFKLHRKSLCISRFKTIFEKLHDCTDASIAFVVAIDFEKAFEEDKNWKYLPDNYTIYSLTPVDKTKNLSLVRRFPNDISTVESSLARILIQKNAARQARSLLSRSSKFSKKTSKISSRMNEPRPKRKKRDNDRPLTIILVSLKQLNFQNNTKDLLKLVDCFTGGM